MDATRAKVKKAASVAASRLPLGRYRKGWSDIKIRAAILDWLDANPGPQFKSSIAVSVGVSGDKLAKALEAMVASGEVGSGLSPRGARPGPPVVHYFALATGGGDGEPEGGAR